MKIIYSMFEVKQHCHCFHSQRKKRIYLHKVLKQILKEGLTQKTFDVQIVIIMCILDSLFLFSSKLA